MDSFDRRDFLRLASCGGVVFSSGLFLAHGQDATQAAQDFFFVQLSDSHWGYEGDANPDAKGTLPKAVAAVNALARQPDFVVFTGDLTHTTDDPRERRRRMAEFKEIVAGLKVKDVRFLAGEHDASLDNGRAFREFFGPSRYTFDHKGVHFIALDNVSDPGASLGDEQLAWLAADIERQPMDARIVVLAHRPLFDLYPQWDWATRDGAKAIALLLARPQVTVFYGHIHQEHHHRTGHIAHHSAKSLIFPLPAAGSQPRRTPLAWDAAHPYSGLGFREVRAGSGEAGYALSEFPVAAANPGKPRVVQVVAKKFAFVPSEIHARKGETLVLQFTAPEIAMGVSFADFKQRADIVPGKVATLQLTPDRSGSFTFLCDVFCGSGHEDMNGVLVVSE